MRGPAEPNEARSRAAIRGRWGRAEPRGRKTARNAVGGSLAGENDRVAAAALCSVLFAERGLPVGKLQLTPTRTEHSGDGDGVSVGPGWRNPFKPPS